MKSAIVLVTFLVTLLAFGARGQFSSNKVEYSSNDDNGEHEAVQKTTTVEQLDNGTCVKKTEETKNGETHTTTELVDCEEVQKEQDEKAHEAQDEVNRMQQEMQKHFDTMGF